MGGFFQAGVVLALTGAVGGSGVMERDVRRGLIPSPSSLPNPLFASALHFDS